MQPEWFSKYLGMEARQHSVSVAGAMISYRRWQASGKPGLLFVHGHAAHSHWWDFIAPAFLDRFDPLAIDLSGAGESDHRDSYSAETFTDEIVAVCEHAGLDCPTLVGHSFGGSMTIADYLIIERDGLIIGPYESRPAPWRNSEGSPHGDEGRAPTCVHAGRCGQATD